MLIKIEETGCAHDYAGAVRLGRAHHICPKCKENITLALVMLADAGIKLEQLREAPNNI